MIIKQQSKNMKTSKMNQISGLKKHIVYYIKILRYFLKTNKGKSIGSKEGLSQDGMCRSYANERCNVYDDSIICGNANVYSDCAFNSKASLIK